MTVKVNIDYLVKKTPFLNKMMHFADNKGNKNGMLDTADEVSCLLKLANNKQNADTLKKHGIDITDNGNSAFTIMKTKDDAKAILSYNLHADRIKQDLFCGKLETNMKYTGYDALEGKDIWRGSQWHKFSEENGERNRTVTAGMFEYNYFNPTLGAFSKAYDKTRDVQF